MHFCKHCKFWTYSYSTGDKNMGTCSSSNVDQEIVKDTDCDSEEDSIIHTEGYFGCIHFRQGSFNVITIELKKNDEK